MGAEQSKPETSSEDRLNYDVIRQESFEKWDKFYSDKRAAAQRSREMERHNNTRASAGGLPFDTKANLNVAATVPPIDSSTNLVVSPDLNRELPDPMEQPLANAENFSSIPARNPTAEQPQRKLVRRTISNIDRSITPADSFSIAVSDGRRDRGEFEDSRQEILPSAINGSKPVKRAFSSSSSSGDQVGAAQKRSRATGQQNAAESSNIQQHPECGDEFGPPKWYTDLKRDNTRSKDDANTDAALSRLKTHIEKCRHPKPGQKEDERSKSFDELRTMLHKIAFLRVSGKLVRKNRMLDNEYGLPQIFHQSHRGEVEWPWDVQADAEELYKKWCRGIFETDLLRGIILGKPKPKGNDKKSNESSGDSLDPKYKDRVSAKYFGNGSLLNGQWWPSHVSLLRDGAHGESQGGICGKEGEGAYSCVMAGGLDSQGREYSDEDYGDWVWYSGTDSKDGKVTRYTQRMIESVGGHPVRLIRSHNAKSPYAPELGVRYDGLYNVVEKENLDGPNSLRQRHRFKLVRVEGQAPIRGGNGPEKRPTAQEIEEFKKHKHLMGRS